MQLFHREVKCRWAQFHFHFHQTGFCTPEAVTNNSYFYPLLVGGPCRCQYQCWSVVSHWPNKRHPSTKQCPSGNHPARCMSENVQKGLKRPPNGYLVQCLLTKKVTTCNLLIAAFARCPVKLLSKPCVKSIKGLSKKAFSIQILPKMYIMIFFCKIEPLASIWITCFQLKTKSCEDLHVIGVNYKYYCDAHVVLLHR